MMEEVNERLVKISWLTPEDLGGRTDHGYKLHVWRHGLLIKDKRTSSTLFTVDDLAPNTYYSISVTSYNGAGDGPKVVFNVTTAGEPGNKYIQFF